MRGTFEILFYKAIQESNPGAKKSETQENALNPVISDEGVFPDFIDLVFLASGLLTHPLQTGESSRAMQEPTQPFPHSTLRVKNGKTARRARYDAYERTG